MGDVIFKTDDPAFAGFTIILRTVIAENQAYEAGIEGIIDGDTIDVEFKTGQVERVRLLGIDTPEFKPGEHADMQCAALGVDQKTLKILAKLSTIHLQGFLLGQEKIVLKTGKTLWDDYNRLLANLFIGDLCIDEQMATDGYALAFKAHLDFLDYRELEARARQERKGIFGACREDFYPASARAYHRPGCSSAQGCRQRFQTILEARAAGLKACKVCLPDFSLIKEES